MCSVVTFDGFLVSMSFQLTTQDLSFVIVEKLCKLLMTAIVTNLYVYLS